MDPTVASKNLGKWDWGIPGVSVASTGAMDP